MAAQEMSVRPASAWRTIRVLLAAFAAILVFVRPSPAFSAPDDPKATVGASAVGIAIMHGKGGLPTRYVDSLASFLESQGFRVANIEMPWSGRRDYDVTVEAAESELQGALDKLRAQGARKFFVAGHSQGGLFAMAFATRHAVDGVVALAPGGYADGALTREKLGDSVARAKQLIGEGKGNEKARLSDFEGARGVYPIIVTPAIYMTWFDPEGAMTIANSVKKMPPQVPVLFVVPTNDYPGLLKAKGPLFAELPAHPKTRLYEPDGDHLGAPRVAREEVARWLMEVAGDSR